MGIVDGKIAIVTGSGRGVGRGEAMELAAQGAKVVVCDPGPSSKGEGSDERPADETVEIIRDRGGEAVATYEDISSWDAAARAIQVAIDTYGALDVVVNNAGILRDASITKMTEDEWDSVISVHLKGTFNMTHHACVYWSAESKEGRPRRAAIVNTVSSAGLQGNAGQANYGAAKAGIAALTVITALEGARYGVRANAVAPGGATRMVNEAMPNIPIREANEVPDNTYERLNPGNSAPMVAWLASDESLLVSGQVFRAVGNEVAHYLGWHLGPTATNQVKGEPAKWDPTRIGSALAKNVFGLQPGGLQLGGR
ncbi:MAG TPA: SDR family NAD(P)-dependent oxidoreductase [Acidimicrobiales bacterium]|nr:SDR family NAD(P)-dependent oxidoreductase [Acidimicrobiales bacterium]